ncbi:MarR family winged helix-turn-helix transcriptional regulator [Phreatobacter sp. HK31-P]
MIEPPDPAAATLPCICGRVRRAARRVSQIYDRHLQPFDLTITQFGLLAQVRGEPDLSIGQLADRMVMDPTSLTRGLKPLERRGLLRLAPDPDDRRTRRVSLTPEGLAALKAARPGWEAAQAEVQLALGHAESADLVTRLDHTLMRLQPR